ncbi:MAG TPA: MFS transporter [Miltoncostaeales bacterium]|nr:MFS transporter [Miltoncostaeales bacterium]
MGRRSTSGGSERRENFFLTPLGIVFTTVVIDLIGFGIVVPILPLWAEDLGASATVIGFLAASYSAMQFIFAPLLGRLSDRYGRRPVILISLLGSAISSFMIGFANSIILLFVARILNGISGASYSTAQAYVADITTKENRARGMGLIGAAFGIGFIIGPALGGLCALVDKRLPFFVSGALALANMAIAWKRLPETDRRPAASGGRLAFLRRAIADRTVGPLVVITFLGTFAFTGMETTFSLLGRRRFDFDLTKASLIFAFIGIVAAVLQGKLIGPIVDRMGERRVMNLGIVLTAAALGLLAVTTNVVALFPVAALLAASGLVFPTVTALVSKASSDDEQGAMLGVLASASGLARAIGPVAAGALFDWAIPAPYLVGAGLFALCLLIGRGVRDPEREVAAAR